MGLSPNAVKYLDSSQSRIHAVLAPRFRLKSGLRAVDTLFFPDKNP